MVIVSRAEIVKKTELNSFSQRAHLEMCALFLIFLVTFLVFFWYVFGLFLVSFFFHIFLSKRKEEFCNMNKHGKEYLNKHIFITAAIEKKIIAHAKRYNISGDICAYYYDWEDFCSELV